MAGADFTRADLRGLMAVGANFDGATFKNANLDGERHERNRSNEFHGEAGQVEGVAGAVFSEIATGEHRRGAAVHRARVPGAGTERSGVHPHSVAFEHGVDHARTLGNSLQGW